MFLVLVTDKVTIPLGFSFYESDPKWMKWSATDKKLKKQKIPKKDSTWSQRIPSRLVE